MQYEGLSDLIVKIFELSAERWILMSYTTRKETLPPRRFLRLTTSATPVRKIPT